MIRIFQKLVLLFIFPFTCIEAQYVETEYKSALNISLGSFYYVGDLTDKYPVVSESQLAWGLGYTHKLQKEVGLSLAFHRGRIQAFDTNNEIGSPKYFRNLNFRTYINEISLIGSYNLLSLVQDEDEKHKLSAKLLLGVAFFSFDPEAFYEDNWIKLQPLGTEGQGLAQYPNRQFYSLYQWSIPFGGTLEYAISERFNLGLTLRWNKTFTDYIDDASMPLPDNAIILSERGELAAGLSDRYINLDGNPYPQGEGTQRGDSNDKDWYGIMQISLAYRFNEHWYTQR